MCVKLRFGVDVLFERDAESACLGGLGRNECIEIFG